jgi:DNA polymerase-3 subunit beta
MKLSCTQENLNQGLFVVSHVSSKNINLPILNNVLLKAEDGVLKLMATNLEIGVTCIVRGKIDEPGEFTVQSKLFSDYVSLLPNEKVDIELKDQSLDIKCKKFKTKIRGQEASDFPLIPKIEKTNPYVYKIEEFIKAVNQVAFAVSQNEARLELSGVFMSFSKNSLAIAATDSYRLAERIISTKKEAKSEASVIVPARTLQELLRILSGYKRSQSGDEITGKSLAEGDEIEVYLSENQILFSFDSMELVSRTIEGQYPNYRQIIPSEHKTKAILSVPGFVKTVKTASLFSKSGIFDINLDFIPADQEIEISSVNNQLGESNTRLETEISGENNKITVNYRYLLDGLQNIGSDLISFEVTNDSTACLLRPLRKDDGETKPMPGYLYIIMPIKQ